MTAPLAIDLFCGLGGWTEGLLAEGYRVQGFDIEAHAYGDERYPADLVLEDVSTLDGARFADAALIVASPPCQEYSYMAMPWSRAKAKAAAIRADETGEALRLLNQLFVASFRIQREASAAAGRHIPLVVENVRGAIPWVGRSRWNYGSYHLWGDVPALMPPVVRATKVPGFRFDGRSTCFQQAALDEGRKFNPDRKDHPTKNGGGSWFAIDPRGKRVQPANPVSVPADGQKVSGIPHIRDVAPHTKRLTNPAEHVAEGRKGVGSGADWFDNNLCRLPSASRSRKAASARIAKIPLTLSRWIAAHYYPSTIPTSVGGVAG